MSKKVLIVDDDMDFIQQLEIMLGGAGYDVTKAMNLTEAQEKLDAGLPDIAIVDLMMENPDAGFVLCYKIKKMDAKVPVIIVSAVTSETNISFDASTPESKEWIRADAFLSKPIRFEQLQGEIERLLGSG